MNALKCDRCGKYYDSEETQNITVRKRGNDSYDLCDDCYLALTTWLEELKPSEPESSTEPTTDPDTDPATDPSTDPTTDPLEGGDDNG